MSFTPNPGKVATAIPHLPIEEKKSLWVLHYRAGNNPHPMQKNFMFAGDLRAVVDRAKKHCENVGIRFVRVHAFLSDLDREERKQNGMDQDESN